MMSNENIGNSDSHQAPSPYPNDSAFAGSSSNSYGQPPKPQSYMGSTSHMPSYSYQHNDDFSDMRSNREQQWGHQQGGTPTQRYPPSSVGHYGPGGPVTSIPGNTGNYPMYNRQTMHRMGMSPQRAEGKQSIFSPSKMPVSL